jgi:tetratricopeptide (TPR) repeat protein
MKRHFKKSPSLFLSAFLTALALSNLQNIEAHNEETFPSKETDVCRRYSVKIEDLLFHHQDQQALVLAGQAIQQDKNCAKAYMRKGFILANLDKPEEAINFLRSGFKLCPNFPEHWAWCALAQALFEVHQEKQAFEVLDKGLIHASGKHFIYDVRARMHAEMNNFDLSIKDFTTAIDTCPDKSKGDYRSRGLTYMRMHQYQKAISDFDQAIKYDSKNAYFYTSRSKAYEALGKTQRAKIDAAEAKRLSTVDEF